MMLSAKDERTSCQQIRVTLLGVPLLAGMLASCLPLPGGRSIAQQEVAGKSGEDILVARSGDSCRVAADVFERIRVGDMHMCTWQSSRGSGETVLGDPKRGGIQRPVERPRVPPRGGPP